MTRWVKEYIIWNIYWDIEIIWEDKPYKSKTSSSFSRIAICKCKCWNIKLISLTNLRQWYTKSCWECIFHIDNIEWEIWKDIPWYEWKYWASNKWRIRWKKWILKYWNVNTDYCVVSLSKGKRWDTFRTGVHRLVMKSFVWDSVLDVNHIDWNKKNNNLENLEYVTKSENMKHAYSNWLINIPKW